MHAPKSACNPQYHTCFYNREFYCRAPWQPWSLRKLTTMNQVSTQIQTTNHTLLLIQVYMNLMQLIITFRLSLTWVLKYSTTTGRSQSEKRIIQLLGKPLRRCRGIEKHTVIYAITRRLYFLLYQGCNFLLGFLKVNSQSRRTRVSFQIVSVTWRSLAIALCIPWRRIFNPWTHMAHGYDGSKDTLRTTRKHYHSPIVTS